MEYAVVTVVAQRNWCKAQKAALGRIAAEDQGFGWETAAAQVARPANWEKTSQTEAGSVSGCILEDEFVFLTCI